MASVLDLTSKFTTRKLRTSDVPSWRLKTAVIAQLAFLLVHTTLACKFAACAPKVVLYLVCVTRLHRALMVYCSVGTFHLARPRQKSNMLDTRVIADLRTTAQEAMKRAMQKRRALLRAALTDLRRQLDFHVRWHFVAGRVM